MSFICSNGNYGNDGSQVGGWKPDCGRGTLKISLNLQTLSCPKLVNRGGTVVGVDILAEDTPVAGDTAVVQNSLVEAYSLAGQHNLAAVHIPAELRKQAGGMVDRYMIEEGIVGRLGHISVVASSLVDLRNNISETQG